MGGKTLALYARGLESEGIHAPSNRPQRIFSMSFCAWVCFEGWSSGNMTALVGAFDLARRQPE